MTTETVQCADRIVKGMITISRNNLRNRYVILGIWSHCLPQSRPGGVSRLKVRTQVLHMSIYTLWLLQDFSHKCTIMPLTKKWLANRKGKTIPHLLYNFYIYNLGFMVFLFNLLKRNFSVTYMVKIIIQFYICIFR